MWIRIETRLLTIKRDLPGIYGIHNEESGLWEFKAHRTFWREDKQVNGRNLLNGLCKKGQRAKSKESKVNSSNKRH